MCCAAVKSCQFNKEARNSKHRNKFYLVAAEEAEEESALLSRTNREDEWILESFSTRHDFSLVRIFFASTPFNDVV